MTAPLIEAAVRLADTLALENAALDRLDLAAAAALLDVKTLAMASFAEAVAVLEQAGARHWESAAAREVAARLTEAAARNRALLERAIAVQGRVIEAVVAAAPASVARAQSAGRYGAGGRPATGARPAMALIARA